MHRLACCIVVLLPLARLAGQEHSHPRSEVFIYAGSSLAQKYENGSLRCRMIETVAEDHLISNEIETHYPIHNHLSSTTAMVTSAGTVTYNEVSWLFGQTLLSESQNACGPTRQFTGQLADDESGWVDFRIRKYDAMVGRFLQPDPASHVYSGLAPYAYVANSPVNLVDPSGALMVRVFDTISPTGRKLFNQTEAMLASSQTHTRIQDRLASDLNNIVSVEHIGHYVYGQAAEPNVAVVFGPRTFSTGDGGLGFELGGYLDQYTSAMFALYLRTQGLSNDEANAWAGGLIADQVRSELGLDSSGGSPFRTSGAFSHKRFNKQWNQFVEENPDVFANMSEGAVTDLRNQYKDIFTSLESSMSFYERHYFEMDRFNPSSAAYGSEYRSPSTLRSEQRWFEHYLNTGELPPDAHWMQR